MKTSTPILTARQRHLLRIVARLGSGAYGVPIRQAVEAESGFCPLGTLYARLDCLETAGLVTSWLEPGGGERGFRDRRYYRLTSVGRLALEDH